MGEVNSFCIDHDKLEKGVYIYRKDGDVITYDVRMKKPNGGDYLSNGAIHTFEHLLSTVARGSRFGDAVLYVGPMGCRTGFFFLLRDSVSRADTLSLIREAFAFVKNFEGTIPGSRREECGNYAEHDLSEAKAVAEDMLAVLADWTEEKTAYPQ
ncbi:MAG: S-ribosylhomocysteine lyase [Lachnospiraceae bacterium]|nr:S-ribosylhomocysteine lyase [Lachnospiraceae bacterium]